jgi:hypothetical protein
MATIAITSFVNSISEDEAVQRLTQALESFHKSVRFFIGTKVQEPTTIQITSEWPATQSLADLRVSAAFQAFENAIYSAAPSEVTTITAWLDVSPFASRHSPLVEFVKTDFPAAEMTPALEERVKSDFARFEAIYRKRGAPEVLGEGELAIGWTEEQDGIRAFLVIRGWTGMDRFDEAVDSGPFKEGIPILMGWGKPFSLWHVKSSVVSQNLVA